MLTTTMKYECNVWDLSKFKQGMTLKITPYGGYGWSDKPFKVELLDFDDDVLYTLYTDEDGKHELIRFNAVNPEVKLIEILE